MEGYSDERYSPEHKQRLESVVNTMSVLLHGSGLDREDPEYLADLDRCVEHLRKSTAAIRGEEFVPEYRSERGHRLVYSATTPPTTPTIVVEDYMKWYELYVVCGEEVMCKVHVTDQDAPSGQSAFVDHAPNPNAVIRLANRLGYAVDDRSLEVIAGRWFIEAQNGLTEMKEHGF